MFSDFSRSGQSLVEVLIAIAVGVILVIAALGAIVPALTINKQLTPTETGTTIGVQLMNNVKAWSEGDWHNILNLATGSANIYYLKTGVSPYVAATGSESIVTSVVGTGLVGWWKLNEGTGTIAYDSSGNNATGTWYGTKAGSSSYYSPGSPLGWAGYFDGSTNYIDVPQSSALQPSSVTVTAWIYATASSTSGLYYFPVVMGGGNLNHTTNGYYLGFYSDGSFRMQGTGVAAVSGAQIPLNTWIFVAGTISASATSLFMNGNLVAGSATGGVTYESYGTSIGRLSYCCTSAPYVFHGPIGDVRIYNRALSSSEINQIYTAQKYTRSFYLSDVNRTSGNIVTSGGTYDPSTKLVTVQYQIPPGVTSTISAYLTRHGQNIYDQTDWSGGGGVSTTVTTPNGQFASSTNIDVSTTTGSFYIAIPGY